MIYFSGMMDRIRHQNWSFFQKNQIINLKTVQESAINYESLDVYND